MKPYHSHPTESVLAIISCSFDARSTVVYKLETCEGLVVVCDKYIIKSYLILPSLDSQFTSGFDSWLVKSSYSCWHVVLGVVPNLYSHVHPAYMSAPRR